MIKARFAMERIKTGIQYGDDMKSSKLVCFLDAVKLLNEEIDELNDDDCKFVLLDAVKLLNEEIDKLNDDD
jgi:hypothetical protein